VGSSPPDPNTKRKVFYKKLFDALGMSDEGERQRELLAVKTYVKTRKAILAGTAQKDLGEFLFEKMPPGSCNKLWSWIEVDLYDDMETQIHEALIVAMGLDTLWQGEPYSMEHEKGKKTATLFKKHILTECNGAIVCAKPNMAASQWCSKILANKSNRASLISLAHKRIKTIEVVSFSKLMFWFNGGSSYLFDQLFDRRLLAALQTGEYVEGQSEAVSRLRGRYGQITAALIEIMEAQPDVEAVAQALASSRSDPRLIALLRNIIEHPESVPILESMMSAIRESKTRKATIG
jgi:hypothetical protein